MKKVRVFIPFLFFVLLTFHAFAQGTYKQITLADQWKTWTFWANSVYGINSMNDGIHYTTISENGDIIKYSYETGNVTDTIFNAAI
jgi:dipeptidyl-peptidase-4